MKCSYPNCSDTITKPLVCKVCNSVSYCSNNCRVQDFYKGHQKVCKAKNPATLSADPVNLAPEPSPKSTNALRASQQLISPKVLKKSSPLDHYEITSKILGTGSYGEVKLVKHRTSGQLRALKIISKQFLQDEKINLEKIFEEIANHKELNHQNIIKYIDHFEDPKSIYIVLEYAENGNLFDRVKTNAKIPEPETKSYFKQVIEGIEYLHLNEIIHRDIKPENILISASNKIKICDFGWCVKGGEMRSTFCGTLDYMAPEMVKGLPHSFEVDIWALGVLLFEMLHGYPPFEGMKEADKCVSIVNGKVKYANWISDEAKDLIGKMIQINPDNRIKVESILKHPFFIEKGKESICQIGTTFRYYVQNYGMDDGVIEDILGNDCFVSFKKSGLKMKLKIEEIERRINRTAKRENKFEEIEGGKVARIAQMFEKNKGNEALSKSVNLIERKNSDVMDLINKKLEILAKEEEGSKVDLGKSLDLNESKNEGKKKNQEKSSPIIRVQKNIELNKPEQKIGNSKNEKSEEIKDQIQLSKLDQKKTNQTENNKKTEEKKVEFKEDQAFQVGKSDQQKFDQRKNEKKIEEKKVEFKEDHAFQVGKSDQQKFDKRTNEKKLEEKKVEFKEDHAFQVGKSDQQKFDQRINEKKLEENKVEFKEDHVYQIGKSDQQKFDKRTNEKQQEGKKIEEKKPEQTKKVLKIIESKISDDESENFEMKKPEKSGAKKLELKIEDEISSSKKPGLNSLKDLSLNTPRILSSFESHSSSSGSNVVIDNKLPIASPIKPELSPRDIFSRLNELAKEEESSKYSPKPNKIQPPILKPSENKPIKSKSPERSLASSIKQEQPVTSSFSILSQLEERPGRLLTGSQNFPKISESPLIGSKYQVPSENIIKDEPDKEYDIYNSLDAYIKAPFRRKISKPKGKKPADKSLDKSLEKFKEKYSNSPAPSSNIFSFSKPEHKKKQSNEPQEVIRCSSPKFKEDSFREKSPDFGKKSESGSEENIFLKRIKENIKKGSEQAGHPFNVNKVEQSRVTPKFPIDFKNKKRSDSDSSFEAKRNKSKKREPLKQSKNNEIGSSMKSPRPKDFDTLREEIENKHVNYYEKIEENWIDKQDVVKAVEISDNEADCYNAPRTFSQYDEMFKNPPSIVSQIGDDSFSYFKVSKDKLEKQKKELEDMISKMEKEKNVPIRIPRERKQKNGFLNWIGELIGCSDRY